MAVLTSLKWFVFWLVILPSSSFQTFFRKSPGQRVWLSNNVLSESGSHSPEEEEVYLLTFPCQTLSDEQKEAVFGVSQWKPAKRREMQFTVDRWKLLVMGENPNPNVLEQFHPFVKDSIPSIRGCSAISTCVRFEILLVVDASVPFPSIMKQLVALIAGQIKALDKYVSNMQTFTPIVLEPGVNKTAPLGDDTDTFRYLLSMTQYTKGVEDVCRHLCLVSTALDPTPQLRLEQRDPLLFQPFESFQSAVLRQFKDTVAVTKGAKLKCLLDAALHAGKLARDEESIPEISNLRVQDNEAPPCSREVAWKVTNAVRKVAVEDTVAACVERIRGMDRSNAIVRFRSSAQRMGQSQAELRWIRQRIHAPTEEIRKGKDVDVDNLLKELLRDLEEERRARNQRGIVPQAAVDTSSLRKQPPVLCTK